MQDVEITMISIPDLAKAWGCSRNFIWGRCKSGEIPATQIGDRWFIPIWWVKEQVSNINEPVVAEKLPLLSVCCGAEEHSSAEGICGACNEYTGFEETCPECESWDISDGKCTRCR